MSFKNLHMWLVILGGIGAALVQVSVGNIPGAVTAVLTALAGLGLIHIPSADPGK